METKGVDKVRELMANRRCRVVLMPMFRSFIDIMILHQIKYLQDFEIGFTFSQIEDSPKIRFLEALMHRVGCFQIKRQKGNNNVVNFVNQSLLHDVIEDN